MKKLSIKHNISFHDGYPFYMPVMSIEEKPEKRFKEMKEINFNFDEGDFGWDRPLPLQVLVGSIIPEIITAKSNVMDFQNAVVDAGRYNLEFDLRVKWDKK